MKKLINKDNKKKKIIMVCVVLLLITIVYFVPFDFKYVKLRKGYPSVGLSSVEYAERSRTLDDSVCVVLKREGECQKVIQRVSSNQLVSFKCEMSQRKFDFFTTLKWHYYSDEGHYCYVPKWHGVKLPYEDIEKPIDILAKIDCLKIQYYDIDKNKLYKEEDLLPWLKKYDKNNALYGLNIKRIGIVNTNNTVIYCDGKYLKSKTNGYQVYEHVYPYSKDYHNFIEDVDKEGYMDVGTFEELLKENGIKTEGIDYYEGSDLYGELNMDINTEDLPKSNAKLYKVYPGLKKYIGQKGKQVQLHLSGINDPDILVGYFLPDGKKVTYGKKGIKIVGIYFDDKCKYKRKTCKSFQEYLKIKKQAEYDNK